MRNFLFYGALTVISKACWLRDAATGRFERDVFRKQKGLRICRQTIESGGNRLDSVFVAPSGRDSDSVVLLCHGIGETVANWVPVQRLLGEHGVASLVFDYSGYGRSTGRISSAQCERDAEAAFAYLASLMPGQGITLLGFSLGSGIAAEVVSRVKAKRLVLCAAFTSFREGAHCLHVPRWMSAAIPDIWRNQEALRRCPLPVLIVHGERDQLFPVSMARELQPSCGGESELLIVPGLRHNQPFYFPDWAYWGLIGSRISASQPTSEPVAPAIHLGG